MSQGSEPRRSGRPTKRSEDVSAAISGTSGASAALGRFSPPQPSATLSTTAITSRILATIGSTSSSTSAPAQPTLTPASAEPVTKKPRRSESGDKPKEPPAAVPSILVATPVPLEVNLADPFAVEAQRIELALEEICLVHDGMDQLANDEAHFDVFSLVDRHVVMLRSRVAPLLLDHCKQNFRLLTNIPLTLETLTTFLFQLDFYSTFNTSPSQVSRDAASPEGQRAFYHPPWLLSGKAFRALLACLSLRKFKGAFAAPYSECGLCKVFLCTEKRFCCGGRTCYDVHHCDFSYPLGHPMDPDVIGAQASRFVSIVATPVKKKEAKVDESEDDSE